MLDRTTVRTVVTLVTALCVATMFAGSAAALDLGAVDVGESEDEAVIDVNLETEADDGGGSGDVAVDSDEGGAEGSGAVAGDLENQSLTVSADGEGGPADQTVGGSVECEVSPDSADDPQNICEFDTPGGEEPPIPEPPSDEVPELPGDDLPIAPGGQLPTDGLLAL